MSDRDGEPGFVTNEVGDVYGRQVGDDVESVEPESFGWAGPRGKNTPSLRRSLDQLASLPGFSVGLEPGPRFVPGPRLARSAPWLGWGDGAAPPAAAQSKGGGADGTLAYNNRLSDAFGHVAESLPGAPSRSPFLVHDFVGGRRFVISYDAPPLQPGGVGMVYVLDDGEAFKVGHTSGYVAVRIASLQTGNPRLIRTVATIEPATDAVEAHLHSEFAEWNRRGEWFEREPLRRLVDEAGGWEGLLRQRLPAGDWVITLHP